MFKVLTTFEAEADLASAVDYLLAQREEEVAAHLFSQVELAFQSLQQFPLRGHTPPELLDYPDKRIREVHAGPYRIAYRVFEDEVIILFVADGRRDIQQTLMSRALRFSP